MSSGISINGRFLQRRPTGVDRVALELLRAWLPRYGSRLPLRAVAPRAGIDASSSRNEASDGGRGNALGLELQVLGTLHGHAWEQWDLPRLCRDQWLLNLCNTGPALHREQLVMLHDAAVLANPGTYGVAFRHWYAWLFARLMRRARVVATVSKFSAGELQRYLGRRPGGIEVIHPAGEHILRAGADGAILRRLGLEGGRYVLGVGTSSPNKNFRTLAKAATLLQDWSLRVVAVGGQDRRIYADAPAEGANLVRAGYVSDAELRALYENAQCFVFPSLYEGFGLPPLEAMHCGCPVIVSDRAALPEVCGRAALYCDPEDARQIAAHIRRLCQSESLREDMRGAGRERAAQFSWGRSAERLNEVMACEFRMAA